MADVRRRQTPEEASKPKIEEAVPARSRTASTGLPINAILALVSLIAAGWLWYSGAFSSDTVGSHQTPATSEDPPSPVQAGGVIKGDLTDAQLRAYDGSDASKPLYLAINGTIFDVSSGRGFYGPGGHYGHFAGRDASRAWVTECWDDADQLTHDMRGVEEMFMPKYIDEELTDAVNGKGDSPEALREQAKQVIDRFGKVTGKERRRRREEDTPMALEKVEQALKHWVDFFAASGKYAEVGKVVREDHWEENAPAPPALCEEARKKRPVKGGGKLESIMQAPMKMGGAKGEEIARGERKEKIPDFVKEKLAAKGM